MIQWRREIDVIWILKTSEAQSTVKSTGQYVWKEKNTRTVLTLAISIDNLEKRLSLADEGIASETVDWIALLRLPGEGRLSFPRLTGFSSLNEQSSYNTRAVQTYTHLHPKLPARFSFFFQASNASEIDARTAFQLVVVSLSSLFSYRWSPVWSSINQLRFFNLKKKEALVSFCWGCCMLGSSSRSGWQTIDTNYLDKTLELIHHHRLRLQARRFVRGMSRARQHQTLDAWRTG